MAIRFVDPAHAAILRDYLDAEGVVLVFPEAQDAAIKKGWTDGCDAPAGYDFGGGDPDVYVDKVTSENHFIFSDDDDGEGE